MAHHRPINDLATFTRRRWMQAGGAMAGAMLWPGLLRAKEAKNNNSPAKQAIVIYLQGGLSHYESFDPKPDAPSSYRGEFGHIRTAIPGVHFSEHLPLLAKHAKKFNLIRSAYVDSPSHPVAIHMTLTGADMPGASVEAKNRNMINPSIGSVIAKTCGSRVPQLPAYVAIPHSGQLGQRVHYASAGALGAAYEPMHSGMTPDTADGVFAGPEDLTLPSEQAARRLKDRVTLLKALNGHGRPGEADSLDTYHRHALELLNGGVAGSAFDLNREPLRQRERYGNHLWGQQTILARRLAEAGVPFTLVNYTLNQEHGQDWDTHVDSFNQLKNKLLPPMDLAVSTLLDDLEERGLLESTIVAMYGEFGRTPRINPAAGRDHWEKVFSVMIAGGGLKSGVVVGASTREGDVPLDRPVHFNDVLATIYHQLGVRTDGVFLDNSGRPNHILDKGTPIQELL
ncbi:MAG TPA: DUF1501 domain-containing protein [Humisphaera sp.]|nr:DUF1501 domain-containing protein [Humisphaera sp.]